MAQRLSDIEDIAAFDPEGTGYDADSAAQFGLTADETGHFPSRVPETGLILKGRNHPTFDKTIAGEREAGYEIYKGPDTRYYSRQIEPVRLSQVPVFAAKDDNPYRTIVLDELRKPENAAWAREVASEGRGFWGELMNSLTQGTLHVAAGLGGTVEKFAELVDKPGLNYLGRKGGELAAMSRAAMEIPEYAPGQKGGAKEFIAKAVGQAFPFMAGATAATLLTGSPLGAFGVGFSVEGESAYQDAIGQGATESQANMERLVVGTLNGAIEQMQVGGLLKGGKKVAAPLLQAAKTRVLSKIARAGGKVTVEAVKVAVNEGLEEALQGTVGDVAPLLMRGQEIESGFAERRVSEFAGGAIAGGILGGPAAIINIPFAQERGAAFTDVAQQAATVPGYDPKFGIPVDEKGDPIPGVVPEDIPGAAGQRARIDADKARINSILTNDEQNWAISIYGEAFFRKSDAELRAIKQEYANRSPFEGTLEAAAEAGDTTGDTLRQLQAEHDAKAKIADGTPLQAAEREQFPELAEQEDQIGRLRETDIRATPEAQAAAQPAVQPDTVADEQVIGEAPKTEGQQLEQAEDERVQVSDEPSGPQKVMDTYFADKDEQDLITGVQAKQAQDAIKKAMGIKKYDVARNPELRRVSEAMMLYIDLKEHPGQLRYQRELSLEQQQIVELAMNLPAELQQIADMIAEQNFQAGEVGVDAEVLRNARENYIMHLWDLPAEGVRTKGKPFSASTARARARTLDGIMHGWALGYNLKVSDVTAAAATAKEQLTAAVVAKNLIKHAKQYGIADSTQRPGMIEVDHRNFATWQRFSAKPEQGVDYGPDFHVTDTVPGDRTVFQKGERVRAHDRENIGTIESSNPEAGTAQVHFVSLEGAEATVELPLADLTHLDAPRPQLTEKSQLLQRTRLYAVPELANHLNKVLAESIFDANAIARNVKRFNAVTKLTILFTSLYHPQAFLRSYMLGSRGINPAKGWQLGKKAIMSLDPVVRLLVRSGMTIGKIQDYDPKLIHGPQTFVGRFMGHIPVGGTLWQKALQLRDAFEHMTFAQMGPYLKTQAAILELRHRLKKHEAAIREGKMTVEEIARGVAELVNNDFGGLHLGRMGRSATAQDTMRLLLLAPDWTESNFRSVAQMFRKGEVGAVHRIFWARIAFRAAVATILFNFLMAAFDDDDFVERYDKAWKEGRLRWLDIDITPLYRGMGGDSDKRKYFSLIGHFRDPLKFTLNPLRTTKHKGSVLSRVVFDAVTGQDYAGRSFTPMDEFFETGRMVAWSRGKAEPVRLSQLPAFLAYEARGTTPIPVNSAIAFLAGELDAFDAISRSLGFMTSTTFPPRKKKKTGGVFSKSRKKGVFR